MFLFLRVILILIILLNNLINQQKREKEKMISVLITKITCVYSASLVGTFAFLADGHEF